MKSKTYLIHCYGKQVGAIGKSHEINHKVAGETREQAHLRIYDTYEHLERLQMAEVVDQGIGTGTCNSLGIGAAMEYYDCGLEEIDAKIREKAIAIGWPKFEHGRRLQIDKDGRFWEL